MFVAESGNSGTYILDRTGEKWDISQAESIGFKPEKFQYGIGRYAFTPLDDAYLESAIPSIPKDLRVIRVAAGKEAHAYSKEAFMTRMTLWFLSMLPAAILATNLFYLSSISDAAGGKSLKRTSGNDQISIYHVTPDSRSGKAYKLVYLVQVPICVYWKFKTDFDNDFLVNNKYIRKHHFISRSGNTVITEDKYTHVPGVIFRWKTTVFSETHRLDFVLMNPEQCRQKFHYGHIQLESVTKGTRVTQVAYFDFWGASIWAIYPWGGGMKDFLTYTAQWEQETVLRLRYRY